MKNTENKIGLIDRINEDLLFMRRDFVMNAAVDFKVSAITGMSLLVKIWSDNQERSPWHFSNYVSNGIINFYENILPIQSIICNFYMLQDGEVIYKEQKINYYPFKFSLHNCPVKLIEDAVRPIRELMREEYPALINDYVNNQ